MSAQNKRDMRFSCRCEAAPAGAPSPCRVLVPSNHTLIHFPLIMPHRFLFLPVPPRPLVRALTFQPLRLPSSPSSFLSHPLHSFPSLPIYFNSHTEPVPKNLKPCAMGLVGEVGGGSKGQKTKEALPGCHCLSENGFSAGLTSNKKPFTHLSAR